MTVVRQGSPLTVAELLAILRDLPGDMPVVVEGYDGGLDDVELQRAEVALGCNGRPDHFGPHEVAEFVWNREHYCRREALILFRWQPGREGG